MSEHEAAADLAVIVVSYNTKDLLHACLTSLFCQATPHLEVWVVDNASTDGSCEMVAESFPQVHLVAMEENVGFAGGNNVALRAMGYGGALETEDCSPLPEFVLFLNPDTEIEVGALGTMRQFLAMHPEVGVAGCRLTYPDGQFQHSAFRFPTLWQMWFDFFSWPGRFVESSLNGRYSRELYERGVPFPVDHPLGAAMMTRREVISQVGLMDERFFMYAEEIDWNLRVHDKGWPVYCVPRAVVVHHGGASTAQSRRQMNHELWKSRFQLFDKHYSKLFQIAARVLFWAGQRFH